jgi:hypothetical protein
MAEYRVPRLLWESFESVLIAQGRLFVKDVAKKLHVDEKELLKKVMPSSKIKVYLHDTQTDTLLCQAHIKTNEIVHFCRKPVSLGACYCPTHLYVRETFTTDTAYEIHALENTHKMGELWIKDDDIVMNVKSSIVGRYDRDTEKLTIFDIID